MKWKAINESPEGYEPVYSVIEQDTGRDIAGNLEKDEAVLIENVREIYEAAMKTKDYLEEYYMKDSDSNKEKLKNINMTITRLEIILNKIERK